MIFIIISKEGLARVSSWSSCNRKGIGAPTCKWKSHWIPLAFNLDSMNNILKKNGLDTGFSMIIQSLGLGHTSCSADAASIQLDILMDGHPIGMLIIHQQIPMCSQCLAFLRVSLCAWAWAHLLTSRRWLKHIFIHVSKLNLRPFLPICPYHRPLAHLKIHIQSGWDHWFRAHLPCSRISQVLG